jgi:hypothetical protein
MATNPEPPSPRSQIGALIVLVLGVTSIAPLLVAIVSAPDGPAGWLVAVGATGWLAILGGYHLLIGARTRRRHQALQDRIDATDRARLANSGSFRDRLNEHAAIQDRIITIGEQILADGITDPNLTLDHVRLLTTHARDAQALTEDTLTQIGLESGIERTEITRVDVRDQIEQIGARFPGTGMITTGARHFAYTDPAILRVMVRSLISAAVARGCHQIDAAVARDGASVVCTVSDDGSTSTTPPPMAIALARSLGTEIESSRRIGRNHFSVSVPAAPAPPSQNGIDTPLDVIGDRIPAPAPEQPPSKPRLARGSGMVVFPEPVEHDITRTVAARKKDELIAR